MIRAGPSQLGLFCDSVPIRRACAAAAGPERCAGGRGAGKAERARLLDQHVSSEGGARARQGRWLPFPGRATRWLRAGDPAPAEPPGPRRLGERNPPFSFCHILQALAHRRLCRGTGTPLRQSCELCLGKKQAA